MITTDTIVIRRAGAADVRILARLAALDSAAHARRRQPHRRGATAAPSPRSTSPTAGSSPTRSRGRPTSSSSCACGPAASVARTAATAPAASPAARSGSLARA